MQIEFSSVNWLAVLVAAAASFMVGGIWYGALFAKKWVELNGHDEAAQKAMAERQGKTFLGFIVGDLVCATVFALLIANLDRIGAQAGAGDAALLAFLIWLGVLVPIGHAKHTANGRPLNAWLLDAPHELLSILAIAVVIGAWR